MLLVEDIISVRKMYPTLSDKEFNDLIRLDPTFKENTNSVGKYGKWILNLYTHNNLDNLGHVTDLLNRFEENKKYLINKDIGRYRSLEDVEDMLNDENSYQISHRQEVRNNQKLSKNVNLNTEAELIYDSDMWQVWIPKTYGASCRLGKGTTWCTASTESSHYFDHYSEQGKLYININKHNNNEKYQFHFESEQFMDIDDREIDIFEFLFETHKELGDFYNDIVCRWLELSEGTDLREYTQIVYDGSDIDYIISDTHNGEINGTTALQLICNIEDIYGQWDFSGIEFDEYLLDVINNDNREKITNIVGSFDYNDIKEEYEVAGTIMNAAQIAYEDGSINEAHKDAIKALCKSVEKIGRGHFIDESQEFVVTFIPYILLRDYYSQSSHYFNNIIKDCVAQVIQQEFRLFEPQYGWNEFDENSFNNYLSDNL